jgi:large subunit ribosomal protein L14e
MALIENGRVCIVTKGRDAGKTVTIKEVKDKNFVIIVGEEVKERRSNVRHLETTGKTSKKFTVKQVKTKQKAIRPKKARKAKKVAKKPSKKKAVKKAPAKKKTEKKK